MVGLRSRVALFGNQAAQVGKRTARLLSTSVKSLSGQLIHHFHLDFGP